MTKRVEEIRQTYERGFWWLAFQQALTALAQAEREIANLHAEIGDAGSPPPEGSWRQRLLVAEREREEAPVNRGTWSVEPLPGPVPYKVWMPNAAVDQWRELIAARAEVERLKVCKECGLRENQQVCRQCHNEQCEADLARVRAALRHEYHRNHERAIACVGCADVRAALEGLGEC